MEGKERIVDRVRSNLGEKERLTERDSGISGGNREGKWAMSDDV